MSFRKNIARIIALAGILLILTACDAGLSGSGGESTPTAASTVITIPVSTPSPDPASVKPAEVPAPSPEISASPSSVSETAPSPDQLNLPVVTKSPSDESIAAGWGCQFVARFENAEWASWHFVSPDGKTDVDYMEIKSLFPALTVQSGYTKDLVLDTVPAELDGWSVYCRFSNQYGYTDTGTARITIIQPAPAS